MKVRLSKRAAKFLESQNFSTRVRIRTAIEAIPKGDIKMMQGQFEGCLRLRVGGFRVIFRYDGADSVSIYDIGSRGDIYK